MHAQPVRPSAGVAPDIKPSIAMHFELFKGAITHVNPLAEKQANFVQSHGTHPYDDLVYLPPKGSPFEQYNHLRAA